VGALAVPQSHRTLALFAQAEGVVGVTIHRARALESAAGPTLATAKRDPEVTRRPVGLSRVLPGGGKRLCLTTDVDTGPAADFRVPTTSRRSIGVDPISLTS
jgi:hypothetical protein